MNTRTRTTSSAAKGLLAGAMLLTGLLAGTPAAHADHQSCSNRTDVPGVCLKVVNEGVRVTYAEAYHDGRTGAWTGHIDLHREGRHTIQRGDHTPPQAAIWSGVDDYTAGSRICAQGWEKVGSGWRPKGRTCFEVR
ncbi:hypothetical protein [Nonomuraea sp. C10]|uniref:hypothetical protein n=1 Tax=Nonomuraea sp. C10 TaxID=2600577 RepID=UPI0011CDE31F|nr:hypothetical protein [Nonomuraea sp. C10]TXK38893.1 hypothetical protein FR742_04310 [Nonomuraea sp. C10]